ncbi:MAG: GGDEF domain-containing protein [Actinomycetota bacterium]
MRVDTPSAAALTHLVERVTEAGRSGSVTHVMESLVDACVDCLGAEQVSFLLVEHEHGVLRNVYRAGELAEGERRRPVDDTHELDVESADLASAGAVLTMVDILLDGRVWGRLVARHQGPHVVTAGERVLLELCAAQLGLVRSVRALCTAEGASAGRDALTGLLTRAAIDQALDAGRDDADLVIAAFDLDGLKTVNDRYGHAAGDRLIVAAANALQENVGDLPGAVVARVGGDEFAAVVAGTDVDSVTQACAHAMTQVTAFLPASGLSCGVASKRDLRSDVRSGRPLLRLADATLYRAKKSRLTVPLRAWRASTELAAVAGLEPPAPPTPLSTTALTQLEHLRGAVEALCRSVDGAAWWISRQGSATDPLVVIDRRVYRDRRGEGDDLHDIGERYDTGQLPWTANALDGASFWAGINDADVDPVEQSFLAELAYTGNLAAGCRDGDGSAWLVEIFCDPLTARLDDFGPELLRLVRSATAVDV